MLRTNRRANERKTVASHVRKNDEVMVLSGKDRGKTGKVMRVQPSKGTAIVERINFMKKNTRKNPAKNQQGGILETEAPIQLSKLQVICPTCSKPTRVSNKSTDDGSVRACKKCSAEIGK